MWWHGRGLVAVRSARSLVHILEDPAKRSQQDLLEDHLGHCSLPGWGANFFQNMWPGERPAPSARERGDYEKLWKKRSVCIGLSFSFYKRVAWPYKFTLWPKYYNMLVVCSKFVPSYFLFKSACWCFNDYDFITTILSGKKLCSKIDFAE